MKAYTYDEVIERIEGARRFGRLPGVDVSATALYTLGNPQEGLPFVHVAGTNGKGSTCAFLDAILRTAGRKTGRFTSPHLTDFRERIAVDGEPITKEAVTRLGSRLLSTGFGAELTMFDYCLLMAVLYFKESGCDIAIYETGLGGRLDSTNALGIPEVSVITRIGRDHMSVLGDTLGEIASEKAGILKPGTVFVMAPQEPEVERVLIDEAKRAGVSSIHRVTKSGIAKASAMRLRMRGRYQSENAATAMLAAAGLLMPDMFAEVPEGNEAEGLREVCDRMDALSRKGIEAAQWPGRMELISEEPFLLLDAAHNADGAAALAGSLRAEYPGERFRFVMGVMADKEYRAMIRRLAPLAASFVAVTPPGERALPAEELAAAIREESGCAVQCADIDTVAADYAAGDRATAAQKPERTVCFGSLYLLGELRGRLVR